MLLVPLNNERCLTGKCITSRPTHLHPYRKHYTQHFTPKDTAKEMKGLVALPQNKTNSVCSGAPLVIKFKLDTICIAHCPTTP